MRLPFLSRLLQCVPPPSVPTRHPSTFNAPVPHFLTFAPTVFSLSGLRPRQIGSHAGLSAVPQPAHSRASGVAGAVIMEDARRVSVVELERPVPKASPPSCPDR